MAGSGAGELSDEAARIILTLWYTEQVRYRAMHRAMTALNDTTHPLLLAGWLRRVPQHPGQLILSEQGQACARVCRQHPQHHAFWVMLHG